MHKFDDLLDEILHEASNPEPSPGMNRRMMMGLSDDKPFLAPSTWLGVAAIVLIGIGLWLTLVNRTARSAKEMKVQVSKSDQRTGVAAAEGQRSYKTPFISLQSTSRQKLSGRQAARVTTLSKSSQIYVAPLTVSSISIEPLQIASLSSDSSLKERSTP